MKQKFSVSEASSLLLKHFGLSVPVTFADLKSAYRRKAKELHPDVNPIGTELFKEFQGVYDWITSATILPAIIQVGENSHILKTQEGTPLSELGLGFDNTKNGRDCDVCNHLGYRKEEPSTISVCKECLGVGWTYANKCEACGGSGDFKQARSGKIVTCLRCKGLGLYRTSRPHHCTACNNRGYIRRPEGTIVYYVCYNCKGIGEIEIFNPVLPKGLLISHK